MSVQQLWGILSVAAKKPHDGENLRQVRKVTLSMAETAKSWRESLNQIWKVTMSAAETA